MSTAAAKLEFWYEFASTYSYLSAMRIERLAEAAGVAIDWRPFLLGPIFHAQGWDTSPFNLYPAKGRYMVRDMERLARRARAAIQNAPPFPQNSLQAARLALVGPTKAWVAPFTRAVYLAEFARRRRHLRPGGAGGILGDVKLDAGRLLARIEALQTQGTAQGQTELAQESGIFGAPSFIAGDEMFWGDDRLEQALAWAHASVNAHSLRIHSTAPTMKPGINHQEMIAVKRFLFSAVAAAAAIAMFGLAADAQQKAPEKGAPKAVAKKPPPPPKCNTLKEEAGCKARTDCGWVAREQGRQEGDS